MVVVLKGNRCGGGGGGGLLASPYHMHLCQNGKTGCNMGGVRGKGVKKGGAPPRRRRGSGATNWTSFLSTFAASGGVWGGKLMRRVACDGLWQGVRGVGDGGKTVANLDKGRAATLPMKTGD